MSANDGIVELLSEAMMPLGDFKARRMFGGYGFYLDGIFFALLIEGMVYFKTSCETQRAYEAEGMKPFSYATKSGEHALKTYWRVPERLFDEPDEMMDWARKAMLAARSSPAKKRRVTTGGKKSAPKTLARPKKAKP
ncbi:MAG: TfoX/Sxy family protein [Hyphomicrobium sp.]